MNEQTKSKTQKVKIRKGDYGYVKTERKKRTVTTIILFLIPLLAYIGGVIVTETNKNIITIVALVGCLPACKSMVSTIMIFLVKPMEASNYEKIAKHVGNLVVSYEMFLTTYEKNTFVDCFAVCGNKVVGFSSSLKGSSQFVEEHVRKILKQNGYKTEVKVLTELKPFLERLDYMNQHKEELTRDIVFEPDERYPDLSREELIKHTILAISL